MTGSISNIYFFLLIIILGPYLFHRYRTHRRNLKARNAAVAAGMTEPPSLHPVIDPILCLGCSSCIKACPENNVLGLINGKAHLIDPTHCIGHGACRMACPTQSIELVFGTEKRGVDIPFVRPNFETNVPGIYIAGELGGMGLIRNAVTQGRQAVENIGKGASSKRGNMLDIAIIGAGPAGIASTLAAKHQGLNYVTIEQETLGGTVAHYPRGKIVMTAPVDLPIFGKVRLTETTKEELLDLWRKVEVQTGIEINYKERVESITAIEGGFEIKTTKSTYQSRSVLLAIGRRGTPRKLGVQGEELAKVVYSLIDAEQYRGRHVLISGGGDSALEAACSIAVEKDTMVTLSYRGDAFSRAKEKNRIKVDEAVKEGQLNVMFNSNVKAIEKDHIEVDHAGETVRLSNDDVIVCLGGELPTPFLKSMGINVETKHGTA